MNILIVGLGSIARKHLDALGKVAPQARIYALRRNADSNTIEGVENIYSQAEAQALNLDFAIVSNPTSEHRSTLMWLARQNLPLFIEKPLFDTLGEVPSVSALTYVACNLRFLGCLQWVKQHLAGRRINEVNAYCGSYLPEWRAGVDWRTVYSAHQERGGGVHLDLIHEIDYLYGLFGAPSSVRKVFRRVSTLNISAVDYANYCMIYPTFVAEVVLNYYRRDYKRTLELLFEEETWQVDLAANRVVCAGEVLYQGEVGLTATYEDQMRYFIDLVTGKKKQSINSLQEAYEVLTICLEDETAQ